MAKVAGLARSQGLHGVHSFGRMSSGRWQGLGGREARHGHASKAIFPDEITHRFFRIWNCRVNTSFLKALIDLHDGGKTPRKDAMAEWGELSGLTGEFHFLPKLIDATTKQII